MGNGMNLQLDRDERNEHDVEQGPRKKKKNPKVTMFGSSTTNGLGREQQGVRHARQGFRSRSAPHLLVLDGSHGKVCDNKLSFQCYCYLSQVQFQVQKSSARARRRTSRSTAATSAEKPHEDPRTPLSRHRSSSDFHLEPQNQTMSAHPCSAHTPDTSPRPDYLPMDMQHMHTQVHIGPRPPRSLSRQPINFRVLQS